MANGSTLAKPVPVLAPHGVYVTGDDYLLLTSFNSVASIALSIGGRVVDRAGCPVPFTDRHVPTSDRTATTLVVRLGDGWLQQVSVGVATGAPLYAQTYVRVDICRGDGAGRVVLGTLIQGAVTASVRQAWPGSLMHGPLERGGTVRSITGTDPAAGAEISETVPTGARWRVLAVKVQLVTDATAANREVSITYDDGTLDYVRVQSAVTVTASLTRRFYFHPYAARFTPAQASEFSAPIPDVTLLAGHRILTATTNLQAGDNYGAPQLLVEESLEGN